MAKVICPRCGQDWVNSALLVSSSQEIFICPECDAFWRPDDEISRQTFRDLHGYYAERGIDDPWDDIKLIAPLDI